MPGQGQWDEGRGGSNGLGRTPCTTESTITEAISAKRAAMPVIKSVLTFLDYMHSVTAAKFFQHGLLVFFSDIGRHSRLLHFFLLFKEIAIYPT